eukprot:53990_1
MGLLSFLVLINSLFNCFPIATVPINLFKGVVNICNKDDSTSNCQQRTADSVHSQHECVKLFQSQNTICGCSSSVEASVIIIIDASYHTPDEWQSISLRWLQLYYDEIYSWQSNVHVYYMLSHGDFTLMSLNEEVPDLQTAAFIDNLNELAVPNACVAFKRANEWLSAHPDIANDTEIIYYAKATPFAPSFRYKCRDEDEEEYTFIRGKDILAIKYTDDVNINYVQRDIGEFAYEVSVFPQDTSDSEEIASSIVATVSDFVCSKGDDREATTSPVIGPPFDREVINKKDDCCAHVSGIEYTDINGCDVDNIEAIEDTLSTKNCLFYCNPWEYYVEGDERNWDCITNYALWVQFYHVCAEMNSGDRVNLTMWNDYRWHCPMCYNVSTEQYKSVCRSSDGKQEILNVYSAENCDCRDVTLFLVVIIEITALLAILLGMFVLWYRFNVTLVKEHLKHEAEMEAVNTQNITEEVILNDMDSDDEYGGADDNRDIDSD